MKFKAQMYFRRSDGAFYLKDEEYDVDLMDIANMSAADRKAFKKAVVPMEPAAEAILDAAERLAAKREANS
jgi:hypothetical protein